MNHLSTRFPIVGKSDFFWIHITEPNVPCSSCCFQDSKTPGRPLISFSPLLLDFYFFPLAYFISASFLVNLVASLSASGLVIHGQHCGLWTSRLSFTLRTRTLLGRFSHALAPIYILWLYPTIIFYGPHFYREIWTLHLCLQYIFFFLSLFERTFEPFWKLDHPRFSYCTMPRLGRFAYATADQVLSIGTLPKIEHTTLYF